MKAKDTSPAAPPRSFISRHRPQRRLRRRRRRGRPRGASANLAAAASVRERSGRWIYRPSFAECAPCAPAVQRRASISVKFRTRAHRLCALQQAPTHHVRPATVSSYPPTFSSHRRRSGGIWRRLWNARVRHTSALEICRANIGSGNIRSGAKCCNIESVERRSRVHEDAEGASRLAVASSRGCGLAAAAATSLPADGTGSTAAGLTSARGSSGSSSS